MTRDAGSLLSFPGEAGKGPELTGIGRKQVCGLKPGGGIMEYLKSVIPVIESNYVNFTTVERSIADFFIYNREQDGFFS